MGKSTEEEQNLAAGSVGSDSGNSNAEGGGGDGEGSGGGGLLNWIYRVVGFKCFLMLLLSIAVFLSALFWLPPFLHFADQNDLDLDSKFKDHVVVASFNLEKSFSFLEENIEQLGNDIFSEIGVPTSKVVIISVEPFSGSNTTNVVFAVDPDAKGSKISLYFLSLIRASFESLAARQVSLHLTNALFGETNSFEVLKFPGGITVIPQQTAFLLQNVQIPFNFTLNFSIRQIQDYFNELTSQLKLGLHLMPYENLYIRLLNSKGSTVAPPTIVESYVLLAVGNSRSKPRLKQLAQAISGSHSKNLGLNNTVFGRVKQVRLSSILQHSLHGGDNNTPTGSPSSAPLPQPNHHHHHHHHHHQHHHSDHLAPAPAPVMHKGPPKSQTAVPAPHHSSPAPKEISHSHHGRYKAKPPGCHMGNGWGNWGKGGKKSNSAPSVAPKISPHYAAPSHAHSAPPMPKPAPGTHSKPAAGPLRGVVFAHTHPPVTSGSDGDNSNTVPLVSPSPSSSSASCTTVQLAYSLLLAVILHIK